MVKKIPSVFANKVGGNKGNNNTVFYSASNDAENVVLKHFGDGEISDQAESEWRNNERIKKEHRNITQKISDIFASPRYVYKADVEITLRDKIVVKRVIGKNSLYLITMENELIPISDVVDIKYINN